MAQGHSNMRKCVSNEFRCPKVPGPMLPILITGKPKPHCGASELPAQCAGTRNSSHVALAVCYMNPQAPANSSWSTSFPPPLPRGPRCIGINTATSTAIRHATQYLLLAHIALPSLSILCFFFARRHHRLFPADSAPCSHAASWTSTTTKPPPMSSHLGQSSLSSPLYIHSQTFWLCFGFVFGSAATHPHSLVSKSAIQKLSIPLIRIDATRPLLATSLENHALNLPGFTLHLTAASSSFVVSPVDQVVNSNAYLQCIEFISFKACLGFTRTFLRKYLEWLRCPFISSQIWFNRIPLASNTSRKGLDTQSPWSLVGLEGMDGRVLDSSAAASIDRLAIPRRLSLALEHRDYRQFGPSATTQVIRTPSTYVLRLVFSRPHRRLQFGPGLERRDYLQIVLGLSLASSVGLTDAFNLTRPGLNSPGGVIFELSAILLFDIDTKPLVLVDRCVCVVSLVVIFERLAGLDVRVRIKSTCRISILKPKTRIQCFGSYTYLQPNWTFRGQGKTQPRLDANSNINSQPASFSLKFLSLSLALPSARLAFIPASSSSPIELRLESKPRTFGTRRGIQSLRHSILFRSKI
ncbi:hypothetical protein C8R47DRAFT_1199884 [Mycena vitilis]|nr:hypothetical protein C8R47DRAFT_1199884 [Mycena vitilis]